MKRWTYGMAVYLRRNRGKHKPEIDTGSGTLPMEGFTEGDRLHLDRFLKLAGERGWELTSIVQPFAQGDQLSEEISESKQRHYQVQYPADIQWLLFKREA